MKQGTRNNEHSVLHSEDKAIKERRSSHPHADNH